MTAERMVCSACGPRKMKAAQLIFREIPEKADVTRCAFCGEIRFCRCWEFRFGGKYGRREER